METKNMIDYSQAKDLIVKNLNKLGIEFVSTNYNIYTVNGAVINFNSPDHGWHNRQFKRVNITINTSEYSNRKRLYVRKFDVETGDYSLLKTKILELEKKNKEIKNQEKERDKAKNEKYNELLQILKPYGSKTKYDNAIEVKFESLNLEFTFYPVSKDYAKVSCTFRGGEEEAINLIKKLKGIK